MKYLIDVAVVVGVGLTSFISIGWTAEIPRNAYSSHIIYSVAYPKNSKVSGATYHVGIAVTGVSISQLLVEIPEQVYIREGVEITDQSGRKIDATNSFNRNTVMISFAQPVSSGAILELEMKGVNTSGSGNLGKAWLFPIATRSTELNTTIPIGTARIQTYK